MLGISIGGCNQSALPSLVLAPIEGLRSYVAITEPLTQYHGIRQREFLGDHIVIREAYLPVPCLAYETGGNFLLCARRRVAADIQTLHQHKTQDRSQNSQKWRWVQTLWVLNTIAIDNIRN
jgi:hypothetical protein